MADAEANWLAHDAPSVSLPDLGRMLRDYRSERSLTQASLAAQLGVDQTYVSKIERGHRPVRDVGFLLRVCKVLDIPPGQVGLSSDLASVISHGKRGELGPGGDHDPVTVSQERWRAGRRYLNQHRAELANLAAGLYPREERLDPAPLIAPSQWLPDEPVRLEDIHLEWAGAPVPVAVDGSEPESQQVRPLRVPGRQYDRYTSAVRYLEPPRLFENRPSYRLLNVGWSRARGSMRFGLANYFDKLDLSEAVGHELALARMKRAGGKSTVDAIDWAELPFRSLIGDAFNHQRRALIPAITTLTLRRRRTHGTASFLLHWRDPAKVATASGLYDVIPAGEFQPSSMAPWDRVNDFDLWRNIVRELSEELLGTPEHDGSRSTPIDYEGWDLYRALQSARTQGKVSVYCLGAALDALTLATTIMTVLVIDDDVFDDVFCDVVRVNAEGITVSAGGGQTVGDGIAFTDANVQRLLGREPMAPPGAGCLARAWRYRVMLLTS